MSEQTDGPITSDEPIFNVFASMPSGVDVDDLRHRAINELGLTEAKVVPLLDALRRTPSIKIGSNVTKQKAEQATADFSKIGLKIELRPVLALDTISKFDDGKFTCPACDDRVVLPENRQCPSCGVFVDKVSAEFLMRKKILAKERAIAGARADIEAKDAEKKNLEDMERRIRAEIRAEIEKEMGLGEKKGLFGGIFAGKQGLVRGLIMTSVVVAAGVAGRVSNSIPGLGAPPPPPEAKVSPQDQAKNDINKMMGAVDATGAAAMDVGGAPLDDPSEEESLMQVGKKGLTAEQAVAAASKLGKMAGNNTIENAMKGGVGLPGGVSKTADGNAGAPGAAAGSGTSGTNTTDTSGDAAVEFVLPTPIRAQLAADFAVRLAEMGQSRRGKEIIKSLNANPEVITDLTLSASVKLAEIELRAWAVSGMSVGGARSEIELLNRDIATLPASADRVIAYSRAASALAQARRVTGAAAPAFATAAGDLLKSIPKDAQVTPMAEWTVAMAEVVLSDIIEHARQGQWKPAQSAYDRLATVLSQPTTPEATGALAGIDYRARMALGQNAKADTALENGISRVMKAGNMSQQAGALQSLILKSRLNANVKFDEALAKLASSIESSKAPERAKAMGDLAQVYAALGQEEKAFAMRQQASVATGTATPEAQALTTSQWVKAEISLARARHRESAFAALETIVQRVAGYLL